MSKLSKRAIPTIIITILLLSTIISILPLSYATHTSTATVAFTSGASTLIGGASSLDVVVTNVGPDPISTVKIDFALTDFTGVAEGTEPIGWTGVVAAGVVTYTGGTIAPTASVTFVPDVTNPVTPGVTTNPVVKTSDSTVLVAATLTTGTVGINAISYIADVAGVAGNLISIAYINPGASGTLSVAVVDQAIAVTLATDVSSVITSTCIEVEAIINGFPAAAALVDASTTDALLMVATVGSPEFLTGGTGPTTDYSTTATGTLTITLPTGTLSISTTPIMGQVSVDSGAWVDTPWSGVVDVGGHTVDFATVTGWTTPLQQNPTVTKDTTTNVLGTYELIDAPISDLSIDYLTNTDLVLVYGGDYGDKVIVFGSGVTAGEDVKVGWDGLKAWDGEKGVRNSSEAKGDGSFEVWFKVPEALVGAHFIWVKDMDTGDTAMWATDFMVVPKVSLSPDSGLEDDKITIKGYGFSEEEDITTITFETDPDDFATTPNVPETDDLGSWECTFKVPAGLGYTDYTVTATDYLGESGSDEFRFGANIAIEPDEGPVGTIVEIEGVGFTPGEVFNSDEVTINNIVCKIAREDTVGTDTEFRIEVVIPQTHDEDLDDYELIVEENDLLNDKKAHDHYDVTGLAEIDLDPSFGVQGTKVSIEGVNFTQISGKMIELYLCDYDTLEELSPISDDLDTDSSGEFTGTFTAPAESSELYKIKAKMDDYNIYAYASFRIGLMIVIPTPSSGPTGTEVTLTGTGFTEGEYWNATFGEIAIVEGTDGDVDTDSDLLLDTKVPTFFVPTVDPGTYTITVLDIDSDVPVPVEWTVTATTIVEFDPLGAPNDYNVTITGNYFNADSDLETERLEFILYNVTADGKTDDEWEIDVDMTVWDRTDPTNWVKSTPSVELDKDGNFTGFWFVEDDETLSLGDYILNVTATDVENIFAQAHFSVIEKSIIVDTRKSSFARGQTVAFDVESTFPQPDSYIEIYDPAGDLYWTTDLFIDTMWLKVGMIETVPYYFQTAGGNALFLLEDAALGTWSWEWYDDDDDELDDGTFTVTAAAEDILSAQLEALGGDLSQLSTDFSAIATDMSGLSANVESLAESVSQAISAANAATNAVSQVATAVANVADTAQNAADAANDAVTAASNAQEAAESAGAAASGLTNLVYGAIVASLVAALAAIVSLMQISKRIAG